LDGGQARKQLKALEMFEEAERQITACNACRYCEGFCPVFPAMERRTLFLKRDLVYLANLCHDCKACYYACPYTPPNELAINIPAILSEVRLSSYKEYTSPRNLAAAFEKSGRSMAGVALFSIALMVAIALALGNPGRLFVPHLESGSFYSIFPYMGILAVGLAVGFYVLANYLRGILRFFSDVRGSTIAPIIFGAILRSAADALGHRAFRGGGAGCNHEETSGSLRFLTLHGFVIYGFLLAVASTILAAMYQDLLGVMPPYPFTNPAVASGVAGGVLMVIGTTTLAVLKSSSEKTPTFRRMMNLDMAFLLILDLTSISGLATLIYRASSIMGLLFVIHMGLVLALFVTAPYGKFIHFVYRYAALLVNRAEELARPA